MPAIAEAIVKEEKTIGMAKNEKAVIPEAIVKEEKSDGDEKNRNYTIHARNRELLLKIILRVVILI